MFGASSYDPPGYAVDGAFTPGMGIAVDGATGGPPAARHAAKFAMLWIFVVFGYRARHAAITAGSLLIGGVGVVGPVCTGRQVPIIGPLVDIAKPGGHDGGTQVPALFLVPPFAQGTGAGAGVTGVLDTHCPALKV